MSSLMEAFITAYVGPTVPMQHNLVKVLQVLGDLGLKFKLNDEPDQRAITSLRVKLPDTDLELSVQTAAGVTHYPGVVCETALWHGEGLVYVNELEYSDVCKWTSDEFKSHLLELTKNVKGKTHAEFVAEAEAERKKRRAEEEEEEEEEKESNKKARTEEVAAASDAK